MDSASSNSYISFLASHEENPYHLSHVLEFAEMSKRIALETINEVVPQMVEQVCLKVIKEYLNSNLNGSLNYDIENIASISIANFNKMLSSKTFSKFMSDAVAEEVRKRIDEIHIELNL